MSDKLTKETLTKIHNNKHFGWQVLIDCDHANFRTGVTVQNTPVSDNDIKCVIQEFQRAHPFMQKPNVQALAFLAVSYFDGAYFESLDIEKFWTEEYRDDLREIWRTEGSENIG